MTIHASIAPATALLGLDVGTTTVKAWLYDAASGVPLAGAAQPTPLSQPQPGWAEHDPQALWLACAASIRAALAGLPPGYRVAAGAIASMGEAGLPLDTAGQPLFPIIAYYDPRAASYVAWWRSRLDPQAIHALSGQILRPPFAALRLQWLRDTHPARFAKARHWLSVGDYIAYRLTGVAATDRTLASRTMLLDQQRGDWSGQLLALAELPRELLPTVHPSGALVGRLTAEAAAQTDLPVGLPIATGGHDHLCGALAAGVVEPGQALVSLGTAAAVLAPLAAFCGGGAMFAHGLSCYHHTAAGRYLAQGGQSAAGAALAWLARTLRGAATPTDFAALDQQAAQVPPGAEGLIWLPHLRGSGTPQRDGDSCAALLGLREDHGHGAIWRAMIESLAYWVAHNLALIAAATGQPIAELTLVGGVARGLMPQVLADVTGRPVRLPVLQEAAACGAARLAGQALGLPLDWSRQTSTCTPEPAAARRYAQLYQTAYLPLYGALQPIHQALRQPTLDD